MKGDLKNGYKEKDKNIGERVKYGESMSKKFSKRIKEFLINNALYILLSIAILLFLYNTNIFGIKASFENFISNLSIKLAYVFFQTNFLRGIIEILMAIGSFWASQRTKSDIIRTTTRIVGVVLILIGILDIAPAINYLLGG